MIRTQIYLPESLHEKIKMEAKKKDSSMADIIRTSIELQFSEKSSPGEKTRQNKTIKNLLKIAGRLQGGPGDISLNHDFYLYGFKKAK